MTSKKIILISSVFIMAILFAGFGYYVFLKQNNDKITSNQKCGETNNPYTKPAEENSDEGMTKVWSTYYDERYKYQIDFPAGLNVATIYEHTVKSSDDLGGEFITTNGGVNFSYPANGPWSIIVNVSENSKFQSLDEWLESEKNEYEISVVEKKINIDGNEAIITHRASMQDGKIFEEFKNEKTITFIRNNKLFVIYTRINDSEKVWNSFKFITGRYPIY